jgi:hypothetical protein
MRPPCKARRILRALRHASEEQHGAAGCSNSRIQKHFRNTKLLVLSVPLRRAGLLAKQLRTERRQVHDEQIPYLR